MKLSERIYSLRKERGMTQDDLASACGVSRQSVSKWETGESKPDITSVIQIAKTFDISIDELVYLNEPRKETKTKDKKGIIIFGVVISIVLSMFVGFQLGKNSLNKVNDDLKEVNVIFENPKMDLLHIEVNLKCLMKVLICILNLSKLVELEVENR